MSGTFRNGSEVIRYGNLFNPAFDGVCTVRRECGCDMRASMLSLHRKASIIP